MDKPTKFEPGEKWMYCQSGINTLGRIIEIASGQSLPDFFEKRITGPLGMRDTTFYPSKAQQERIARTYSKNKETGKLEPASVSLFAGLDLADTSRVPLPSPTAAYIPPHPIMPASARCSSTTARSMAERTSSQDRSS